MNIIRNHSENTINNWELIAIQIFVLVSDIVSQEWPKNNGN